MVLAMNRTLLVGLLALAVVSSACSSSTLKLYSRPNGLAPALGGKRVAVLPSIAFGGDPVNAAIFSRANERIFRGSLGGVRFIDPEQTQRSIESVPGATRALDAWAKRAQGRRFFPIEGGVVVLHDGKQALGGGIELKQKVHFQSGGGAVAGLMPDRLEPSWLGDLQADFVLASMTYTKYRRESGVYALFGIIPFAGYSYGGPADVRAHYALYDRRSGRRLWEAYLGVATRKTAPRKWANYPLDPRVGTAIAAAWTLSGEARETLIRLLREDPRLSDPTAP
jgi:hypothetical protein